jgi:hypothetical protein
MKYIIISLLLCLTGCSTVPVVAKFPEAPKSVSGPCPKLEGIKENAKLSELTDTVTKNYSLYYECAVKSETWQEWYDTQKRIFESVK